MSDCVRTGMTVDALRSAARSRFRDQVVARVEMLRDYAELARRGFESMGLRGLADLIRADLPCSRSVARAVAVEVDRFVGRTTALGEPLDPIYPVLAAALSGGEPGFEQAKIIADVIDALPAEVQLDHATRVEALLTEQAVDLQLEPEAVKALAARVVAHLDPDGPEPIEQVQARRRGLHLSQTPDGTGLIRGELTPECLAIWQAVLTPLAAHRTDSPDAADPDATDAGQTDPLGPDARTQAQRFHDAFETAGRRLLTAGDLPQHAGLPAHLFITMHLADLETRVGRATTHHGGTLTITQALHLAADATVIPVIPVILDQELGLVAHGRGQRLATPPQRTAVFARDRGCTFPGCTRTAADSEIHHLTEWQHGGPTNTDNLTITCGYHTVDEPPARRARSTEAPRQGWKARMHNGFPHWIPPAWKDPTRTPQRNYIHHPELVMRPKRDPERIHSSGHRVE